MAPQRARGAHLATTEDVAELNAHLARAEASGRVVILPYNLTPANPPAAKVSEPLDLGDEDAHWAGYKVIVDLDLPLEVQEIAAHLGDAQRSDLEKLTDTYAFLEQSLVAWNFTRLDGDGKIVQLAQPRDGGCHQLVVSQLRPLVAVISKALAPRPNS